MQETKFCTKQKTLEVLDRFTYLLWGGTMEKKKKVTKLAIIIIFMIIFTMGIYNIISYGSRMNILIFGVDARDITNDRGSRSDSIMILNIGSSAKKPILISIPRDTRVQIDGRSHPEKVNHAHAYGGVELLIKSIEEFLDIEVDYYVKVNYQAVEELVDAIGGITLDVALDMKYQDPYANPPLNIDIAKGVQNLGGREAINYLRYRSGYPNQDLGRIESQQEFMNVMASKMVSPATLPKIPRLMKIFYKNVDTNIPKFKIINLGANALIKNSIKTLEKITLPGKPKMINGGSYYLVNDEDISQLKEDFLTDKNNKITGPKIEVLNGCGVKGIAAKYANIIKDEKFELESIGNYESNSVEESFIEYNPRYKKDVKTISRLLGIKKISKILEKDNQVDIRVIVGKDLTF